MARRRLKASAVTIERAEAVSWMRTAAQGPFQLVLLDPPFDDPALLERALDAAAHLVVNDGYIYVESADPLARGLDGFVQWRHGRAGAVCFHLLRRNSKG